MLDTVKINHVQHISFTQSRLTDAVSVILSELLSYEHPSKIHEAFFSPRSQPATVTKRCVLAAHEKKTTMELQRASAYSESEKRRP